jgi:hypothetical protein
MYMVWCHIKLVFPLPRNFQILINIGNRKWVRGKGAVGERGMTINFQHHFWVDYLNGKIKFTNLGTMLSSARITAMPHPQGHSRSSHDSWCAMSQCSCQPYFRMSCGHAVDLEIKTHICMTCDFTKKQWSACCWSWGWNSSRRICYRCWSAAISS